jgi:hypothetical protein
MRLFATLSTAAMLACMLHAEPMTTKERARLLAHLEMTETWLADEIRGLSKAQLEYRAQPEKWSVLDVLEHLTLAEPQYWKQLQDAMKRPASGEKSPATDEEILWYGIDRSQRAKTGEARTSKGELKDPAAGLASFLKLRTEIKEYSRTATEDLRGHPLEKGALDCYQWALMISTHSMRHILQIREIKAEPGYPRK